MDPTASKGTADRVKHILKAMENTIDAVRRKRLGESGAPTQGTGAGQAGGPSHGIGSGVASGYHAPGHALTHGTTGYPARAGQTSAYGQPGNAQRHGSADLHTTIGRAGNPNEATIGRSPAADASQGAYPFARTNGTNANASPAQVGGTTAGQPHAGPPGSPQPGMRLKARPKRLDPSMVKDFPPNAYRSQAG